MHRVTSDPPSLPTFPTRAGILVEFVAKPIPNTRAAGFPTNLATIRSRSLWMSRVPTAIKLTSASCYQHRLHYIPSSNLLFWNSKGIELCNLAQIQVNMEDGFFNLSSVFVFKLCHFKAFDDYEILHNLSMLLTYIVTLYHIQWSYYGCGNWMVGSVVL